MGLQVLNLIGFICVSVTHRSNSHNANWFCFVAFGGLLITLVLLLLFLFHLIEKLHFMPWLLIVSSIKTRVFDSSLNFIGLGNNNKLYEFQELVYCGIWTFFYFTAATAVATLGQYEDPFAAAAVSLRLIDDAPSEIVLIW
jgi:hypothetical protein